MCREEEKKERMVLGQDAITVNQYKTNDPAAMGRLWAKRTCNFWVLGPRHLRRRVRRSTTE
jgi:hypothetical protein